MSDITVNIIDGVANISQAGFGIPAIFGETQQFKVLKIGSGKSELVVRSKNRGQDASVEIVQSGASITFEANSFDKVTITIPTAGATAAEVVDAFEDTGVPTEVEDLIVITLGSTGSGAVDVFTDTPLADVDEFVITNSSEVANLLPYYLITDPEYVMTSNIFSQDLKVEKMYVFNAYEGSPPDIATKIITFDNQDFYFLLLTDTSKARIIEAANWTDLNDKVTAGVSSDVTILDDLVANASVFITLMTTPANHHEANIVGAQAPKDPGATTWKFQRANGATAEEATALISAARDSNGNAFIESSNLIYYVEGKMTNGLFIDQKRSRDFVKARIEERFLALFVAEEKIPYDDTGISQIEGTLSDALNSFGVQGIIASAVSAEEVENSHNGVYQYTITAKSRAQVLADSPADITNRAYTIEFEYVEAGAIHNLTVTGKIVLSLV